MVYVHAILVHDYAVTMHTLMTCAVGHCDPQGPGQTLACLLLLLILTEGSTVCNAERCIARMRKLSFSPITYKIDQV